MQPPHERTAAVSARLLLHPTYVLRVPHAIGHPPPATAPQSIRSNRRAHPANIHHRGHTRFRRYNNVSEWGPRPRHRMRKRTRSTPRNTGSARLATVQPQRVCAPHQSRPINRANTSPNRQHRKTMPTSANSSSHHTAAAESHLRAAVATSHPQSRPVSSDPTAVPNPPTSAKVLTPGSQVTTTCPRGVPAPYMEGRSEHPRRHATQVQQH
jgi:hypothetical protein